MFVIGGAQIYRQALPLADELLLTEIDLDGRGRRVLPGVRTGPTSTRGRARPHVAEDGTRFAFVDYRRHDVLR